MKKTLKILGIISFICCIGCTILVFGDTVSFLGWLTATLWCGDSILAEFKIDKLEKELNKKKDEETMV